MIRALRVLVSLIFVAALAAFAFFFVQERVTADHTYPVIKVDSEVIEVKPGSDKKELLKGVTAYDEKDGDLTARVVVESVSKFTEKGVCIVNYAVSDADHHVAGASRKVKYIGYTSPVFDLNRSVCFGVNEVSSLNDIMKVTDCIDGDISSNTIITSDKFSFGTKGVYDVTFKASNSKGDTVELDIPVTIEERVNAAPTIALSKYLLYVKKGDAVDYNSYVTGITDIKGDAVITDVTVKTDLDTNIEGVYAVNYYATDTRGYMGHSVLIVVVE